MRRSLFLLALLTTFAAASASAQATKSFVPVGAYALTPDSGYAGPDIAGLVAVFSKDSMMVVSSPDGAVIVKAKLTFAGGMLTINDLDGTNVCASPGKYQVGGDEKVMKWKSVADGCPDRAAIIDFLKFVRQG
jgi:hypothetical protein